jgi:two-component system KDP operon response regulator KdpE
MPEKKVLIIDADVASRNFIVRNLLAQKYEVLQAGSGKEGLIYAWRDRPDLVVIDPIITDITGEELARIETGCAYCKHAVDRSQQ